MMHESAFKEFCVSAGEGRRLRELFIVPSQQIRQMMSVEMFNVASEMGLCPILRRFDNTFIAGDSVAILRVAHDELARELAGIDLSGIHGIEHVYALENGFDTAERLRARIRT